MMDSKEKKVDYSEWDEAIDIFRSEKEEKNEGAPIHNRRRDDIKKLHRRSTRTVSTALTTSFSTTRTNETRISLLLDNSSNSSDLTEDPLTDVYVYTWSNEEEDDGSISSLEESVIDTTDNTDQDDVYDWERIERFIDAEDDVHILDDYMMKKSFGYKHSRNTKTWFEQESRIRCPAA